MPSDNYFLDKVCLIVGASSGIGHGLARTLAAAGARVAVTARREPQLLALQQAIQEAGGQCLAVAADASDAEAAAAMVNTVVAHYGRVDLLLLNAGGAPAIDTREMSATEVNHYMRSNYDVTTNVLFPVLAVMKSQRGGQVVHTNSLAGFLGLPLQGPYCAAKGATRLLLDTCRLEYAEYDIHFGNVYPGFVATAATRNDGMPTPLEISEEQAVAHILKAIRRRRNDYLFPWPMHALIRLAMILPKPVLNWILAREVKPLSGG